MATPILAAHAPAATPALTPAQTQALAKLHDAATQFEGVFLQMVMSAMRDTVPKESIFGKESASEETWQGMLDDQYSQGMAKSGGLGLAHQLEQQLRARVLGNAESEAHAQTQVGSRCEDAVVGDSWESFASALADESAALGRVHSASLALSKALVRNVPSEITLAERSLDGARRGFVQSTGRRRGMQARGFGKLTLRQVCAYAPRRLGPTLNQRLYELTTLSMNVKLTTGNNKALIASGLKRLIKITAAMQKASHESAGTYRRRGFVPPPSNSVLVSSRA